MRKALIIIAMMMALAFMLVGCASEIEAPSGPYDYAQGTLNAVDDVFLSANPYYAADMTEAAITAEYNVYLPPNYSATGDPYPVLYLLNGYGTDQNYFVNYFNVQDVFEQLHGEGTIEDMIIVLPSGRNFYMGSFYTNNPLHPMVGLAEDHITGIVAEVDAAYNTVDAADGRAIAGHSMGGFGAVSVAMNSDLFGNIGSLAGPVVIEGMKQALPGLYASIGYDVTLNDADALQTALLGGVAAQNSLALFTVAMSAAFGPALDPDPANWLTIGTPMPLLGIYVPVTPDGVVDDTYWNMFWSPNDPIMRFADADPTDVGRLMAANLYFDCGDADPLGIGAMQYEFIHTALAAAGITPDVETYFPSVNDVALGPIVGDHSSQTYERLKPLVEWVNDNFVDAGY